MAVDIVPDLVAARRFLQALTGEENPLVTWQLFADDKNADEALKRKLAAHRTMRLAAVQGWLVQQNDAGAGIYVTVNETKGTGRLIADVVGLRALFVDSDGTPMPATWALAPSIVVQRDPTHWHAYWLLQAGEPLARFNRSQAQLAHALSTDPSVKDLPRVMRVPGFLHRKGAPIPVHLVQADRSTLFTIDQVLSAFPLPAGIELDDKGRRIDDKPKPAARAAAAKAAPAGDQSTPAQWMLEQTRKWMLALDRAAGAANPRGGQDNAAFQLACECKGRDIDRHDAEQLVLEYLTLCGYEGAQEGTERIVRSAYSQPRSATPPVRRTAPPKRAAAPPGSPPPGGGDGGDGGDDDGDGDDDGPVNSYGLDRQRIERRWVVCELGVWPVEYSSRNKDFEPRPNKRVAGLPIWPVRIGYDVAGGGAFWELAWITPEGETKRAWLSEIDMKTGHALVALPDAPVTKRQCEACAVYLAEVRQAVTAAATKVTTRVGWCGRADERTWVWPTGTEDATTYIGGDLEAAGELDAWRPGVDQLLTHGVGGYPALVVLGFAVGAAFSRIAGARNPILGLMHASSSGKGSALGYALSAWCNPDLLTIPASSTSKGIQDRAAGVPDCPILLDELQQLADRDPKQAADALYYLANGQRRITSDKNQQARGGERRFGCGFYAAESPILPGQNTGVHYRVIELTGIACPDEATAKLLQKCSKAHGAIAAPLAAYLKSEKPSIWKERLESYAQAVRAQRTDLKGDDPEQLALLRAGLEAVADVLQVDMPSDAITFWLSVQIAEQRANTADRETEALFAIMSAVLNGHWAGERGDENDSVGRKRAIIRDDRGVDQYVSSNRDGYVAWRYIYNERDLPDFESLQGLEINPSAEIVGRLFREHGGETRVLAAWARHGWIRRDGRHAKVKKTYEGRPVGRVVSFTATAIALFQRD